MNRVENYPVEMTIAAVNPAHLIVAFLKYLNIERHPEVHDIELKGSFPN